MSVDVILLNGGTPDDVGYIPEFLSDNGTPARKQLNDNYQHGGGWNPFQGFELRDDDSIQYPEDPPMKPLAKMRVNNETILVYESGFVLILQPDRSFEIARMD